MNLRRLREGAGLSQEELMNLADVHRTQISKYERGETEPQAEALAKLSRALGVGAEEFFIGVRWEGSPPRLVVIGGPDQSPSAESFRLRLPNGSLAATFPFGA
jgi:transcriptional regulator with XRE-family HTH domain